jgi:hypothetical protein
MTYRFRYTKGFLWRSLLAIGHKLDEQLDRMDVFHEDGSITSISRWSTCDLKLGTDWVLSTKDAMEKEACTEVKLNVKTK